MLRKGILPWILRKFNWRDKRRTGEMVTHLTQTPNTMGVERSRSDFALRRSLVTLVKVLSGK